MRKPIETLAGGLGHPEGPDILPDGRIVMVETYTSKIIAWSRERGIHDYALCGGGPNACMLGSDGALYITQNGGTVGAWRAAVMTAPSIQKAWPDGRVETVATEVDGIALQAPNDLTFGPDGRLYFTDPADYLPHDRRPGRVFALKPRRHAGSASRRSPTRTPTASWPSPTAASCGSSRTTAASTGSGPAARRSRSPSCPRATSPTASRSPRTGRPVDHRRSCGGGVDILRARRHRPSTSWRPAACRSTACSMRATCHHRLGDITEVTAAAPMDGRLWRVEVGVAGMPLFRGAIAAR